MAVVNGPGNQPAPEAEPQREPQPGYSRGRQFVIHFLGQFVMPFVHSGFSPTFGIPSECVVTTYNQSRDHGEQRLGSYLDT